MSSFQTMLLDNLDLLEGSSDLIVTLDKEWKVVRGNSHYFTSSQVPAGEQIGKNFFELFFNFPHAQESSYWINYHIVMKERVSLCFEDYYSPANKWFQVTVYPSSLGGINIFVKDSTDSKEKKQSDSRLRNFFMKAPVPMVILTGPDFFFTLANPPYEKLFGRKTVGKTMAEVFQMEEIKKCLPQLKDVYRSGVSYIGKEEPFNIIDDCGDIKKVWISFAYHAFRNTHQEIKGILAIVQDVTELVESRHQLEKTIQELESERELKEKFVASLTHDLRTPLAAGKMSAQMMGQRIKDEKLKKNIERIIKSMDRADLLIKDLLDASLLKAGQKIPIDIQPCNLNDIIISIAEDLSSIYGNRFIIDFKQSNICGFWDNLAIRRSVENLANNAVKYGAAETPITFVISQDKDEVRISVHNQGNPIEVTDIDTIFKPFHRIGSAVNDCKTGWGIGLSLVRGLTEAHGGSIKVESSKESGTTFTILIPQDSRRFYD